MRSYRKTDLAWLAGFIDGEGYISTRQVKNLTQHGRTGCFATELTVTQTNESILREMQQVFGVGSVHCAKGFRANSKPAWIWSVTGQKAGRVLRLVRPYLKLKREQAEIVIEMCRRKQENRNGWKFDTHRVPDAEVAERHTLVARIRILNKRGVH